ncbi:MAG: undecaprenyl-diphosphate phosphatase [Candidatus Krumholzibacteria bacterium]|nr:undecaprenyl-diphosphate phosphatase [Candidatus Krumholzibacteria bacterium]
MVEILNMLLLAVVQGLTEFLPVSSSGHLVLFQYFLGVREGDVFFDVLLHVGTLGSILVVYRREILRLLKFDRAATGYLVSLAVGTLPAVAVGLLLKSHIEELYHSPLVAAGGLVFTAAVLFSTRFSRSSQPLDDPWEPHPVALGRALLIGIAQGFAILPGISRSGSTIAAALWAGLPRAEAARFSFLLSIPAVGGALVLQLMDGQTSSPGETGRLLLAGLAAFAVGLLAIRWTALAVVQAHFWKFSFYCLFVGVAVLLVLG